MFSEIFDTSLMLNAITFYSFRTCRVKNCYNIVKSHIIICTSAIRRDFRSFKNFGSLLCNRHIKTVLPLIFQERTFHRAVWRPVKSPYPLLR
jgi:hypothetical protein